eukprot:TRINITY_DN16257_c0_g1_i2.p1 TRINITY_DN16257_c0_g1~~TRINITY_DN16257_c0_g1_i2.p1  ORF type:complete len:703 (+),score=97.14 TRINITY_DN16257_c0_g1_i2:220-2328(+)
MAEKRSSSDGSRGQYDKRSLSALSVASFGTGTSSKGSRSNPNGFGSRTPSHSQSTVVIVSPLKRPAAIHPVPPQHVNPHQLSLPKAAAQTPTPAPKGKLKWKRGNLLGQGQFGKVYLGLNEDTGQLLAIKVIDFTHINEKTQARLADLQNEIKVMKKLTHPKIVGYVCSERIGSSIYIFMEFIPGGSLASLLHQLGELSERTVAMYTKDIASALEYLHQHKIIHRDVKAANVLVSVNGELKLTDFGSSVFLKEKRVGMLDTHGTPCWMAPEAILSTHVSYPADIWSLGCTVMEMMTAKDPFSHIAATPLDCMKYVGSCQPVVLPPSIEDHSHCGAFLLDMCLIKEPSKRAKCATLLTHRFLELDYSEEDETVSGYDEETRFSSTPGDSMTGAENFRPPVTRAWQHGSLSLNSDQEVETSSPATIGLHRTAPSCAGSTTYSAPISLGKRQSFTSPASTAFMSEPNPHRGMGQITLDGSPGMSIGVIGLDSLKKNRSGAPNSPSRTGATTTTNTITTIVYSGRAGSEKISETSSASYPLTMTQLDGRSTTLTQGGRNHIRTPSRTFTNDKEQRSAYTNMLMTSCLSLVDVQVEEDAFDEMSLPYSVLHPSPSIATLHTAETASRTQDRVLTIMRRKMIEGDYDGGSIEVDEDLDDDPNTDVPTLGSILICGRPIPKSTLIQFGCVTILTAIIIALLSTILSTKI